MELLNALQWRYATKKMNGAPVPQEKVDYILRAAQLAPTSAGLQPYEIIVITNPELKKQILPIAFNQEQIVDCSHLLVFAAWHNYTEERMNGVFRQIAAERSMPDGAIDDFKNRVSQIYLPRTEEVNFVHTARQAYIGFGMAIAAAAEMRVDATPMEGFIGEGLDNLLGLDKRGLKSVTLLPLGYRSAEGDWLVDLKKVRKPLEQFVTEMA
jgi:nitroreductase